MADSSCPPTDQIKQFLTGRLDLDEIEAVSAHLEQCPLTICTLPVISEWETDPSPRYLLAALLNAAGEDE